MRRGSALASAHARTRPSVTSPARGKNFGTIAVQLPNGQIASHVMWVDANDDQLLINTEIHRAKYKAIQQHPEVTVTIWDAANPYRYAEVRGRVVGEVRGDEARGAHRHAVAALPRPRLPGDDPERAGRAAHRPDPPALERSVDDATPLVGVVMGSASDWSTMQAAVAVLERFGVAHEARVVSAHRMPDEMFAYAEAARRRAGCGRSSPAPAAPPTCPGCWPPRRPCPCSACPCRRGTCRARTRCCRSCRCRPASRSRRSPSARPGRPTPPCSPSPCSPPTTPTLAAAARRRPGRAPRTTRRRRRRCRPP